jgi:uncharacterized membrane protein YraQ (UPF0718 family)
MELLAVTIRDFWQTLSDMAPYLLFGFLMAGLLSVFLSPELVERHLGTGRFLPVVKASLFGVPLPLCSCSVIPVAASLRQHGANRGATTAFLISTPQTGVDSIFVTYSLLGLVFAIFRPVAAFLAGLFGGMVVAQMGDEPVVKAEEEGPSCSCHKGGRRTWREGLHHGFVVLPRDIAKPLLLGLVIAGLMGALLPPNYFAGGLGQGFGAKVIMLLVGIPVYVCATATVPVAAALIVAGVSPGAALVFLMTGPATNAATITTVWTMMGRATALVYLGVVAVSALASGVLLDAIYVHTGTAAAVADHVMLPPLAKTACAVVLLGVLGWSVVSRDKGSGPTSKVQGPRSKV